MEYFSRKYFGPETPVEAAKILDKEFPGWFNVIDLDILRMTDMDYCVLGQLIKSKEQVDDSYSLGDRYRQLMNQLFGTGHNEENEYMFCSSDTEVLEGWKNEIKQRQWVDGNKILDEHYATKQKEEEAMKEAEQAARPVLGKSQYYRLVDSTGKNSILSRFYNWEDFGSDIAGFPWVVADVIPLAERPAVKVTFGEVEDGERFWNTPQDVTAENNPGFIKRTLFKQNKFLCNAVDGHNNGLGCLPDQDVYILERVYNKNNH